MEMVTPSVNSARVFQCRNDNKRLPHLQSVWVAVGEELPYRREQANSKDPFAVAVTTDELIVGCKQFTQLLNNKWVNFLVS